MNTITKISTLEKRFPLENGDGTDSIHTDPVYFYVVTYLHTDNNLEGTGLVFTIGAGNQEIRSLIEAMATSLVGCEIEELMAQFGVAFKAMADHPQFRWLGPGCCRWSMKPRLNRTSFNGRVAGPRPFAVPHTESSVSFPPVNESPTPLFPPQS